MTKDEIIPHTIEGDWDWRETSADMTEEGWVTLEEKPRNAHVWSFRCDGTMVSRECGRVRYVAEYHYEPGKLRLSQDGWRLDRRGEREMLIYETFRVEFLSPTEMYLYDLDGVQPGEEESLRLMFRRVTCNP